MAESGFRDDFKRNFVTGIAALFPILVTLFLLTWLYHLLEGTVGKYTNVAFEGVLARLPSAFRFVFPGAGEAETDVGTRLAYAQHNFPDSVGVIFGLLLAAVAIYLIGKLLRGYIGHHVMDGVDAFFERFPVIKAIYPYARQVGDLVFGPTERRRFSSVVAVEYPRAGVYTIGFQTGDGVESLNARSGQKLVSVFLPTSPTPVSGTVVMVPADEVIHLDMTVDEAFRYCITAGMLVAGSHGPAAGTAPVPELKSARDAEAASDPARDSGPSQKGVS
jgi:uncharacterized membrane protein